MPTVPAGSLIFVTGGTGYVGSYVIKELLDRGFRVRASARSEAKGEAMKVVHKVAADRFEYTIVKNIQAEGAFDSSLPGVSGIIHVASPLFDVKTNITDDIVVPAIEGTVGIMKSALNFPDIKRIVITSSWAAMENQSLGPGSIFNEEHWNTPAVEKFERLGNSLTPWEGYFASKNLSEKAAWKLIEDEKPHYDIVTLQACCVSGPILNDVSSPDSLDWSNQQFYKYLSGAPDLTPDSAKEGPILPIVDVRDVGFAHVESLVREEAGNRRIGLSEATHFWQEFLDILHDKHPDLAKKFPNANWGIHGARSKEPQFGQDASLSRKLLGFEYKSLEETAVGAAESYLALSEKHGWKL